MSFDHLLETIEYKANIRGEKLEDKYAKDKKHRKVRGHCHYIGEYKCAARSISNLKYSLPKEITIVFHKWLNYGHHFSWKG